jgi:hypothetical protein
MENNILIQFLMKHLLTVNIIAHFYDSINAFIETINSRRLIYVPLRNLLIKCTCLQFEKNGMIRV